MSFINVKNNARSRFTENQLYLNYITSLEPRDVTGSASIEVNIMKGLFYVHLYSSLEKTVNELIENTLMHISSKSIKNKHYNLPFNSISLVDKLKSFKACGYSNFFEKAYEIFNEVSSSNISPINETVFASNLQNVWTRTIEEISNSFGINGFTASPRTKATIDEIVEKRNAVAHGRESARIVGERFRTDVLRIKMETIIDFCNYLIDLFESYYSNKDFLKPTAKRHYSV